MMKRFLPLALCLLALAACDDSSGVVKFDDVKDTVGINDAVAGDGFDFPDGVIPDGFVFPDGVIPDGFVFPDGVAPDGTTVPDIDAPSGTVKALQVAAAAVTCDSSGFTDVLATALVDDVIVTSPKFDAFTSDNGGTSLDGYYVADQDGGLWSGIMAVVPRTENTNFKVGDVLDLSGEVSDRFCNTQLRVSSYTAQGTADAPTPLVAAANTPDWEPYEGMLIKVEGVEVVESLMGGRYKLEGGLIVNHQFDFFLSMDVGKRYNVVGQVAYSFDEFQLYPRTEGDIVQVSGPVDDADAGPTGDTDVLADGDSVTPGVSAIQKMQQSAFSVACSEADGQFQNGPGNLSVPGVIVTPSWSPSGNLVAYGLSDGGDGPWSGVVMTLEKEGAPKFAIGDTVLVKGEHLEFDCFTQLSGDSAAISGTAIDVPVPPIMADLGDNPEQWEGVVVELTDVTVTGDAEWAAFGTVTTSAGIELDTTILHPADLGKPAVGTKWDRVRGLIIYSFGKYRINPRGLEDLINDVDPVDAVGDVADASGDTATGDTMSDGDIGPMPDAVDDVTAISSLQQSVPSIACTGSQIETITAGLTVEAVVVVPRFESSTSTWGYVLKDSEGANGGILMAVKKSDGIDGNWALGTRLRVQGSHEEFFCNTELRAVSVEELDIQPFPEPFVVADFSDDPESWEGVLITVANVKATAVNEAGEISTDKGFVIDDIILDAAISPLPVVDAVYSTVTGVIIWSFDEYRLAIRTMDDLGPLADQ